MIDPVTAVGLATTAFNGIKQAIAMGKDIQDMGSQLSQWSKAISDINYAAQKAEKPPWYKALGGGVQANAVEVWMHKKKADQMREELRSYISLYHGPSAWQEIVKLEADMRKAQKEEIYRKEELKQKIIEWTAGIVLVLIMIAIFCAGVWWLGVTQGKW